MIEQVTNQMVRLAEEYAGHAGLSLSRVSYLVRGNGRFFRDLKNGSDCTTTTAATVFSWFSLNWPKDLDWPRDIPRPSRRAA